MGDHVFICYAREDEDFVLKLATNLKQRGVPVWLDQWNIRPSADWDLAIDDALYECDRFLIVLSPTAVRSREVRGELRTALDEDKPIVPVLYRQCRLPRQLRLIQYVDFTSSGSDDEALLRQVLRALEVSEAVPSEAKKKPRPVPSRITTPRAARPIVMPASFEKGRLYYAETHEWVRIEGNEATCGISDYAQNELADIVYVELPEVDEHFARGDPFAVVESVKAASDFYAPLSGTVIAVNEELYDSPEWVNEDPYGKGWFIKIAPDDPSELRHLIDESAYDAWCSTLGEEDF